MLTPDEEKRVSVDESIYLSENRFDEPKEIFKKICSLIKKYNHSEQIDVCDVGCATGEFLYYLKTIFPKSSVTGFDMSNSMIQLAKKMIPTGNFHQGNINSKQFLSENSFDIVTMTGVLSIFDDPKLSLTNTISLLKPGGSVIISGIFNPNPLDVILRYRNSESINSNLKSGWNVHSCYTVEKIIKEISPNAKLHWHDFEMPFEIKQTSDLMRTWTVKINDSMSLVNGACQIVNMKILEISP